MRRKHDSPRLRAGHCPRRGAFDAAARTLLGLRRPLRDRRPAGLPAVLFHPPLHLESLRIGGGDQPALLRLQLRQQLPLPVRDRPGLSGLRRPGPRSAREDERGAGHASLFQSGTGAGQGAGRLPADLGRRALLRGTGAGDRPAGRSTDRAALAGQLRRLHGHTHVRLHHRPGLLPDAAPASSLARRAGGAGRDRGRFLRHPVVDPALCHSGDGRDRRPHDAVSVGHRGPGHQRYELRAADGLLAGRRRPVVDRCRHPSAKRRRVASAARGDRRGHTDRRRCVGRNADRADGRDARRPRGVEGASRIPSERSRSRSPVDEWRGADRPRQRPANAAGAAVPCDGRAAAGNRALLAQPVAEDRENHR